MVGIQQQDPFDPTTRRGAEYAQIAIYLTPENERQRIAKDIIDALKSDIGKPENFERITFKRVNPGPPQGAPVSLGVRGDSYPEILKGVEELKLILAKVEGVTDIADNYILGREELRVTVKEPEASASLLNTGIIGTTLRGAFEGLVPTTIRELDEKIDVRVTLSDTEHHKITTLDSLFIPNQQGNLVPFRSVTDIQVTRNPSVYEHEDGMREVKVTAELDTNKTTSNLVNGFMRTKLDELNKKYPNLIIDFGGEDEDTKESMASLGRAFLVAIIGIFLMLVLTFKRLLQPLIILITIPLGMMAVIWAFFLHNMPLSFMGLLGIIALSGVIVNNAIMLVDFVNQSRKEGKDRFTSILLAGKMRVRPIFLTTITTIIGVLPTAYGIGGLDKFVVPIAMALGWGLLFGSVLTSFVFPAALAIIDDISEFMERKFPTLAKAYHE
jgi:multidrug efflux pump subunit AcrB